MKAELITHRRDFIDENRFIEIRICRTPAPVPPSAHGYRYSLALIENGRRAIGFDNERGKSDHWHRGDEQGVYEFVSLERLTDDFFAEVEAWTGR
jgi:hypothetical protein